MRNQPNPAHQKQYPTGEPMQHLWWEAWKKWVDMMHLDPKLDGQSIQEDFNNLWYPKENSPEIISKRLQAWKGLVQIAFTEGYEAGFTDRIFNGDNK